ncbi:hypothetical protein FNF28_06183 [Cafeteria roenbergensis]|uniref:Transmembrane protein 135 N-terminal domain-containing protein n=1 Tax=Cafeteria roenbergensis TaxID=33653 RepID=A0A5A8CZG6_CAFRO|nr:hypothetical protein FNF28_06183 [Cafeteria roenbergensis]
MALCGGFVMYAYVMRPEALDPSLRRFMVKTAPIDPVALRATAAVARADPVDAEEVGRFVAAVNPDWRRHWGAGAASPSGWPADMGPPGEAGMSWGRWLQQLREQAWGAINPFTVSRPGKLAELRRWLGARTAPGVSATARGGAPYLSSRHGVEAAAATTVAGAIDAWGSPAQLATAGGASVGDNPSLLLRPQQPVALLHWLETFSSSVRSTFPLYVALGAVPSAAFNPRALVQRPLGWAWGVLATAARSAGFISCFVTVYMASVDIYNRYLSPRLPKGSARSPRALYFIAGMIACATTVLERPSRRGELLLYCFARALEILAAILAARGWKGVRGWDSALLAASVAVLVYAHRFERKLLTSLPRTVLDSLLGVPAS